MEGLIDKAERGVEISMDKMQEGRKEEEKCFTPRKVGEVMVLKAEEGVGKRARAQSFNMIDYMKRKREEGTKEWGGAKDLKKEQYK